MINKINWYKYGGATRIALIYLFISVAYILFSDSILIKFLESNDRISELSRMQSIKGVAFVLLTSLLIFYLIFRELKQKNSILEEVTAEKKKYEELSDRYINTNKELLERKKFTETALDNIPIGVAVNLIDEGYAIYMNKTFSEIYGWPEKDLENIKRFFERVYPAEGYRQKLEAKIFADIQSGDPGRMQWNDIVVTQKSGDKKIVNTKNIPVFDQNLMISTVIDVTDLHKASEDKNMIFNHSIDMICIAGFDGYLKTVNPAWEKTLGWTENELLAKPYLDFVHPDDKDDTLSASEMIPKGMPLIAYINRYRTKNGEYRYLSWNAFPRVEEKRMFAIARDITDAMAKEKEIETQRNVLQDLTTELTLLEERQRKEIASNIHDTLSQSLVISRMKLNGLLKEELPDDNKQVIRKIIQYVDDALESSRDITYNLSPPVLYELGLKDAVRWLVDKTEKEHGLKIETSLKEKGPDLKEDKLILVFRTVQELFYNTIKHSGASEMQVKMDSDNKELLIVISDNGCGFDTSTLKKNSFRSTGFGLFTVIQRIENIGGEIDIKSEKGKGTIVRFSLPLS
ncbi:MAG: PAS domain S-box protein [Bacteroidales bacterium]|nr:PAS domain S-box protein [Bacteroidales bacterium]